MKTALTNYFTPFQPAIKSLNNQIWRSRLLTTTKLKLYNTCSLPIFLYGSECWEVSTTNVHRIEALDQWCLWMLLGIKRCHFVCNDDVWRQTKQLKLTAIIQARQLNLFEAQCAHGWQSVCQEDLVSLPTGGMKKTTRTPRITWLSTIQHYLKCHNLTLPEAVNMDHNRRLWRLLSMSGAMQS